MEIRHLRNFLAIVECGSLGMAARSLGLSQPALTKTVQSLEAKLGARLFDRGPGGATPTIFGRALEPHARTILREADRAGSAVAELLGARRGRVSVVSGRMFAEVIFPTVLQRFYESHPQVEVALTTGYNDAVLAALRAGTAEIAFCMLDLCMIDADLTAEVMMAGQRIIVVAGAGHPLAGRRHVSPREMYEYPWVMPSNSMIFRSNLAEYFARFDLPAPEPATEFDSIEVQRRVLRGGNYIGLISEIAAREDIEAGVLRKIRVPDLKWTYNAGAICRKSVPLTPAARHFIDVARTVSREAAAKKRR